MLYLPGTLIPEEEETRLYEDQPEYALLLSRHIADELIPKLKQKDFQGCLLVPLPTPGVVKRSNSTPAERPQLDGKAPLLALNHEKDARTNEQHSDYPAEVNRFVKKKAANDQGRDIGQAHQRDCHADVKFRQNLQPKN
jgi:hypothetical protein